MTFDEKELYLGLAALHWATVAETDSRWDQEFYEQIIAQNNGPALEIGCGTGRLLLAYLQQGLDVQGVDLSEEVLAICAERGSEMGLKPVLYEQAMQNVNVPHRFKTIYIPCGSFVCVMDRQLALQTLQRCYEHLEPGGTLAFNIYLTDYDYSGRTSYDSFPGPWLLRAEKKLPQSQRLIIYRRETGLNPVAQIWQEERKYELYEGDTLLQSEIRRGQGRWYFKNELLWMLQLAGFSEVEVKGDYTDEDFNATHTSTMVFLARR